MSRVDLNFRIFEKLSFGFRTDVLIAGKPIRFNHIF